MGRAHGLLIEWERKNRAKDEHPQEIHEEGIGQCTRNHTVTHKGLEA